MENKKSYYAIIPADVRYDGDLIPNAKLLYGEITALCNEKGYCWATNNYFAELYGVAKETVSRWISALENKKYISVKIIYDKNSKKIKQRRIYIGGIDENINRYRQKNQDPIDKNINTPIDEKVKGNNTVFNNTFNNTVELIDNQTLRELLNQLKQIKNYPFDTEKDIELINSLLIDFPSLDIKEELKKWAIYKLDKPLKKDSNPRLQFRNWCKNSAKWKAEKEQRNKGTSEQPFRQTKSEIPLPIEYYKFHGLPIPEEVRKREEEGKKANEQMPSSEKVSEILKLAKKEILNKKGEDNGSP